MAAGGGDMWPSSERLYYYHARYYDPDLGRFLQGDTVLDGINQYAYVHNNPVRYTDPTGTDVGNPGNDGYHKNDPNKPIKITVVSTSAGTAMVQTGGNATNTAQTTALTSNPVPTTVTIVIVEGTVGHVVSFETEPSGGGGASSTEGTTEPGQEPTTTSSPPPPPGAPPGGSYYGFHGIISYSTDGLSDWSNGDYVLNDLTGEWGEAYLMTGMPPAGAPGQGGISGFTKHGLNQAISRDGVGVAAKAILDAVKNPVVVVQRAKGAMKYVGEKATVILSAAGKVITTWASNAGGWRIVP
jgi:RHS repeat-associated protein